jgi:hypothetical protein
VNFGCARNGEVSLQQDKNWGENIPDVWKAKNERRIGRSDLPAPAWPETALAFWNHKPGARYHSMTLPPPFPIFLQNATANHGGLWCVENLSIRCLIHIRIKENEQVLTEMSSTCYFLPLF